MKLLSATVKSYRILGNAHVDFDQNRTLIGGANETGKSTFVEAIHRALFLKSTATGEAQKSMVSTLFSGHPQVEVTFAARGAEYRLAKRFSGANGTTRLVQSGGQTWQGEDAESRLASLLGVEEVGGGRGILDRVSQQWAHIWVWQGNSGVDPSTHATSQHARLLQRLQEMGGAVAMQSELDSRVASRFSQARDQIFVRAGSARRGSDLDRAQTAVREAEASLASARERLQRLDQAALRFDEASSTIRRTEEDLERLRVRLQLVDSGLSQVTEQRRIEENQATEAEDLADRLTAMEKAEGMVKEFRDSIRDLQTSLEPRQVELLRLKSAFAGSRKRTSDAENEHERTVTITRHVRLTKELAAAIVNRFEKHAHSIELRTRLERAQTLASDIAGLSEKLAQCAPIDQEGLEALRTMENTVSRAVAALNSMAAEVEVVESTQPVQMGDAKLSTGEQYTVTEPTEVRFGDSLCLRIHPGGGQGLAHAREELRTLRKHLQQTLDEYGLDSVVLASEAVAIRTDLQHRKDSTEAVLDELSPDGLAEACDSANDELVAAESDIGRRMSQVADAQLPPTMGEAREWLKREDETLRDAESNEAGARAILDALRQEQSGIETDFEALRVGITEEERQLTDLRAQLRLMVDTHGDDDARAKRLDEARKAKQSVDASLAQTRTTLSSLQADLLEADRERLQRARQETEAQKQDAVSTRLFSEAALRLDGTIDPYAAVSQAEARLDASRRHSLAVECQASAISLLHNLFQEEQRNLSDLLSQPLAQKISSYVHSLFGPEARAVVDIDGQTFSGIALLRSPQEGTTRFDSLSGGTREQVAAAVRLAIAELLAADHDGSLPVMFDDAFAYSDPDRVNTLQRMLDLGANRGLQLVVLTCNPSDYAALGARQVILQSAAA